MIYAMRIMVIFLLALAASCSSQKKSEAKPKVILSPTHLTFDWDQDGEPEEVIITRSNALVFRKTSDKQIVQTENWEILSHPMTPGPKLELQAPKGFRLVIDHSEKGRVGEITAWEFTYQKGTFIVEKFSFESWSRVDKTKSKKCSLNLFNGTGLRSGKHFKTKKLFIDLKTLTHRDHSQLLNECLR